MNEQAFFHWDLIRPTLQPQAFGMGASLLDFSNAFAWEAPEGSRFGKEKSRDAARSRRGKENYEFYELAKLLPLPPAITSQLDKASIIRLSISYLKIQDFSSHGDPPWAQNAAHAKSLKGHSRRRNIANLALDVFESHQGTHILQSLDGFAFALASDGRFLYISETVSIYLGLSQVEVTGSSIFDYVHVQDHQELAEHLGLGFPHTSSSSGAPSPGSQSDEGSAPSTPCVLSSPLPERACLMSPNDKSVERSFCLRMKSTLTKRGVHVRTSGYRVVYVVLKQRPQICFSLNRKHPPQIMGMVGLAIALPPPTITELRIESDTFIMRLNPDFSIIYCDTAVSELTDWSSEDINNKILYDFCHPGDLKKLRRSHLDINTKGQVLSDYMRLMNKCGGYVWIQVCGTTLYSSKTSDDHTILIIIYVLSGVEYGGCVMDTSQLLTTGPTETDHSDNTDQSEQGSDHGGRGHKDNFHRPGASPGSDSKDPSSLRVTSPVSSSTTLQRSVRSDSQEADSSHDNKPFIVNSTQTNNNFHSKNCESTVGNVLQDKVHLLKTDYKNSRRKADRPKRRRRDYDVDCLSAEVEDFQSSVSKHSSLDQDRCCEVSSVCQTNAIMGTVDSTERSSCSVPEDLSLHNFTMRQAAVVSTPGCESQNNISVSCWQNGTKERKKERDMRENPSSSVKDLEDVMNKHLPNLTNHIEAGVRTSPNDLTSSRHMSSSLQKQHSTIQWRASTDTDTLPASTLLRTLYANRESVIRSSARPQCFSGDNTQGVDSVDMLTPPSNEASLKEQLTLNIPQITVNNSKCVQGGYTNPLSVTVHSTLPDSFSMTPPSSVSPEDKVTTSFMETNFDPSPVSCHMVTGPTATNPVKSMAMSPPSQAMPAHTDYNTCSKVGYGNMSPYQIAEYQQYLHNGAPNSLYDARPEGWYPVSYTS
ncbi:protein trachealess-like isoform X2 [Mizuhopecten yessoensis]|uniref:protein trachealess-like isoform X2 n=1 Tax=Mizuhopecten yessoensis TaxID=6573 RepID=UPI000B45F6A4|nr:protein trachealess-like isoform X2 [Mizuhopecten yessoensis]